MKKLLLLGGSRYLLPIIEAAHRRDCYVITCDYLPNNFAHKYSDEYVNVSIIEKEKVLEIAKKKNIDGIMSFACDPGVVTAAYVAERMGLPYVADYETVRILQNKDLFREFLYKNGFNVPTSKAYSNVGEAIKFCDTCKYPVIVKPVDSAGSKGVSRVNNRNELEQAVKKAYDVSINKKIIIEEYIESFGDPSDCDCFSVDGILKCVTFSNQKFDINAENPFVPAGFVFPSDMNLEYRNLISKELQRLCQLLNLGTSIYNVEARIGKNKKVYLMEVSPRGGGNRLAEMVRYGTGIDLIDASVCAALGLKIERIAKPKYSEFWYEHILHANVSGIISNIFISEEIREYLVEEDLWVKKGDIVHKFSGANETIGTLIFRFPSKKVLDRCIQNIVDKIKVVVQR